MKDVKHRIEFIYPYLRKDIETYLEQQAEKGWMLSSISGCIWTYRRSTPQQAHFAVSLFAGASDYAAKPSKSLETFYDFCARSGWHLAATSGQLQIFYNLREDPVPIETDPVVDLEILHKAMKRKYLPGLLILFLIAVLQCVGFLYGLQRDAIGTLASNTELSSGLIWLGMMLSTLGEMISYAVWFDRTKKAALQHLKLPMKGRPFAWIGDICWILLIAALALTAGSMDAVENIFGIVLAVIPLLAAFLVGCWLKKRHKAARGKLLISISVFVVMYLLIAFTGAVGIIRYEADKEPGNTATKASVLLTSCSKEEPEGTAAVCDRYQVFIPKLQFLYETCKSSLLQQDSLEVFEEQYVLTDAPGWQAKQVYRIHNKDGTAENRYLLCYPDRLAVVSLRMEPTKAQQQSITEELRNAENQKAGN